MVLKLLEFEACVFFPNETFMGEGCLSMVGGDNG
jgi:hypothetical protein